MDNSKEKSKQKPNATPPADDIPTFTPPADDIPTFTPPEDGIPTFTPPRVPRPEGPVCYHHPTEPAVAKCARCGKYICKDCAEAYTVSGGQYANKSLCYDCCEQLVAENVAELTKNKNKIKAQFILQLIGMVLGFIYGISAGISSGDFLATLITALICACIGGVFLSALKAFASLTWEAIKIAFSGQFGWLTVISIIFQIIVIIFKCIVVTISNTVQYILYLKRTQGFIESDSAALQQMRDYMQYTLVRNQNKGVDLEDLMHEGSELYNNTYAQAVRTNGEAAADAALRQATTRIAENGEIIRDFPQANAA